MSKKWKKFISCISFICILIVCTYAVAHGEQTEVREKVLYNGMIVEGSTMLPMREVFELLGAEIKWDQQSKTVTARKGDRSLTLRIGSRDAEINGVKQQIHAAPILYDGVTRVPIRVAGDALGAVVKWDQANRTATVIQEDTKIVIHVSAALEGDTLYVYFVDPAVEKYIRDSLYKPSGSIERGPNPYYGYTGPVNYT